MSSDKPSIDWEAVEREYRAGQLSVREIARAHGLSEGAIRKKAKASNWSRALADRVRKQVRERLVREDGTQAGTHPQRATDGEIVDAASERGFAVVISHRRDLQQLHGLKRILAERLSQHLDGVAPDGPCLGDKETPGDLLEKLSRVTSRLIPLERQAHSLDSAPESDASNSVASVQIFQIPDNGRGSA
jgi:hypothetical protein